MIFFCVLSIKYVIYVNFFYWTMLTKQLFSIHPFTHALTHVFLRLLVSLLLYYIRVAPTMRWPLPMTDWSAPLFHYHTAKEKFCACCSFGSSSNTGCPLYSVNKPSACLATWARQRGCTDNPVAPAYTFIPRITPAIKCTTLCPTSKKWINICKSSLAI